MEKILILGGGGFIGLNLIRRLVKSNYNITTLLRNKKNISSLGFMKKVKIIEGSVTDLELMENVVKGKDVIINLIGLLDRKIVEGTMNKEKIEGTGIESLKVNCLGELNTLETIRKFNREVHHIFISSRAVFGKIGENGKIIKEDQEQKPFSFYGIHKQTCESYINYYKRVCSLNITVLRVTGVYGPSLIGNPKNIVPHMIIKCLNNEDLIINSDGSQIKDFIYIDDLIDLFLKTIGKKIYGVYNIGGGEGFSMMEIAYKIKKVCKSKSQIKNRELSPEEEFFELDGCILDISKIKKASGWEPKIKLEDGVKKIKEFYERIKYQK